MKKRIGLAMCGALLLLGVEAKAWLPAGWVWFQPHTTQAYDFQTGQWYHLEQPNSMLCWEYAVNDWVPLGQSLGAGNWSWIQWPYAYQTILAGWFYCDVNAVLQCFNYSTARWSALGTAE